MLKKFIKQHQTLSFIKSRIFFGKIENQTNFRTRKIPRLVRYSIYKLNPILIAYQKEGIDRTQKRFLAGKNSSARV